MSEPTIVSGADPKDYFGIEIVDEQTGRGVPMVELETTSRVRFYTDSSGLIAFYEPGLMNQKVWFGVSAHGYEFAPDGFGIRGVALQTEPGTQTHLKIKRLNIAERIYRVTGQGIYRDSVLLGRKPPIAQPLLNGEVTGQDGILTAVYREKIYWFWGDTSRLSYALGGFAMTGATTDPPDKLNPATGIDLHYFLGKDGFARSMSPIGGEGVVWLCGVVSVPDAHGQEHLAAYFQRLRSMETVLEEGFVLFNDEKEMFEKVKNTELGSPLRPTHYPFPVTLSTGEKYFYFPAPYPALRVKADLSHYTDLGAYESYTCLKPGTRYRCVEGAQLDRDQTGKLRWEWRRDTPALKPQEQIELVRAGKMRREESPQRLESADGDHPIVLHNASCFWNDYRKKHIMIVSELGGTTALGEIWYAEADQPEGPWVKAIKIVTHANKRDDAHDFYNPTQHPFLDQEGGRVIYFEGSYVNTFSGNPHPTPYYEYNQIMYRLDLSDARLAAPKATEGIDRPTSLRR